MPLDSTTLMKALDLTYDKVVDGMPGVPGMQSVEELAEDYLNDYGPFEDKVDALIQYQVLKATTSGFVTGLGGLLTLPVAIPTNLISVMYLQLQMVAAIAHMGGYNAHNDRVKTVCYTCLCGESGINVLKGAGITVGKKLTERAIRSLSIQTIKKINQTVGFRLITKFGQTGVLNLGKAVPIVGGVIGGAFDGTTTYTIGKVAKSVFITGVEASRDAPERDEEEFDIFDNLSEWFFPEDDEKDQKAPRRGLKERQSDFLF